MPHRQPGSTNWYAYQYQRGKRVRRTTGTADYKEACAIEAKWKAEAHQEKYWEKQPSRTFEEVTLRYLKETASKKSHDRDIYALRAMRPHFTGMVFDQITPDDVASYRTARLKDVSPATVAKEIRLGSAIVNYANREWGWMIPNPFKGRAPKERNGRIRWITHDEARRLIGSVPERTPYLKQFIILGLNTGLRHRELLGLTWDRVDFANRLIYLDPEDQKTSKYSSVPINDDACQALRECRGQDEEYVLVWRGAPVQSVRKAFATACRDAGIDNFTPHDLRHTCAAWLIQAGVAIREVAEILRHNDIQMTMRYAHLAPDNARKGLDKIGSLNLSQTLHRKKDTKGEKTAKNDTSETRKNGTIH